MKAIAIVGASLLAGARVFTTCCERIERRADWTEALEYAKDLGRR